MHTHRVEVLDRAHHDHVVVTVTHQLELEFLPAVDGFLDQHVGRRGCGEAVTGHPVDVFGGVGHARAEPTHGERRANHNRQAEFGDGFANLVHGETHPGTGGFATHLGDDVLEPLTVLAALDRFEVGADQFDAVPVEDAVLVQRDGRIQRRLPAEGGQQRVDLVAPLRLLRDHPLDEGRGDRFDVRVVGELRVGHDRRRVGVDEADLQPVGAQHPAGLRARIVELTGLSDDDRPGADHQHVVQVGTPRHLASPASCGPTPSSAHACTQNGEKSVQGCALAVMTPPPSGRRTGRRGIPHRAARPPPRGGTAPRRRVRQRV